MTQCPECLTHRMDREDDEWVCSCGHRMTDRTPEELAARGIEACRRQLRDDKE